MRPTIKRSELSSNPHMMVRTDANQEQEYFTGTVENHILALTGTSMTPTFIDVNTIIPKEPWENTDGSPADDTSTDINYPNGNVGIGVTSPTHVLDVDGQIKLRSYGDNLLLENFGSSFNNILAVNPNNEVVEVNFYDSTQQSVRITNNYTNNFFRSLILGGGSNQQVTANNYLTVVGSFRNAYQSTSNNYLTVIGSRDNAYQASSNDYLTAIGSYQNAYESTSNNYLTAIGSRSNAFQSTSNNNLTAIGSRSNAGQSTSNDYLTVIGSYLNAAQSTSNDKNLFIGSYQAGYRAFVEDNNIFIGNDSNVEQVADVANAFIVASSDITGNQITGANVTAFISAMSLVTDDIISLYWTSTDGTFPSNISANEIITFKVIDSNTIEQISQNLADAGTGNHTLTPFMDYSARVSNTIAFGEQAKVNRTGQIKIGSTSYEDVDILTNNGGFGIDNTGQKYWLNSETGTYDGTPIKYIGVDATGKEVTFDTPSSTTPGIDAVLAVNESLTANRFINLNSNAFGFSAIGGGTTINTSGNLIVNVDNGNTPFSLIRNVSGIFIQFQDGTDDFTLSNSNSTPEGSVTANTGSVHIDSTEGELYIKRTDTLNQDWYKVYVENYDMSFNAEVTQTSHGFLGITALYHNGTTYLEANGSSATTAADTIFITAKDVNTMVLTANGIVQSTAHGLTIGAWYCLNPAGTGFVLESTLISGNNKQYVFFVLDANQLQINLQTLDVII